MSGFINSKESLIDFKITSSGEDKLSTGDFSPKFYTFDDSDALYEVDYVEGKSFKVLSTSERLPTLENNKFLGFEINPQLQFNDVLSSYNSVNETIIKSNNTSYTLTDYLISNKLIDDKTIKNKPYDESLINFSYIEEKNEFNFGSLSFKRRYPTIESISKSKDDCKKIVDDKRFSNKTKNLFLKPKGITYKNENDDVNLIGEDLKIENILKNYTNIDLNILEEDSRKEVITKVSNLLKEDNNIFKLKYEIQESDVIDESPFLFELHKVNNNNLEKLSFIHLEEVVDKVTKKQINVYLIGKIIFKREKEEIEQVNRNTIFRINNSYSFVNIFTLVVE